MNYIIATMLLLLTFVDAPSAQTDDGEKLGAIVTEMFDAGIGPGRSAAKAHSAYEQARRRAPADPRIKHAWGLIQYRRMKRDEAMKLFAEAADAGAETYFPARQTAVWLLISSSKNRKRGLAEIQTLAHQLADATDEATRQSRLAIAEWISEILAAARKTATRAADVIEIESVEQKVREILDAGKLSDSWAAGRLAIENRYAAEVQDGAAQAAAAAKKAEAESKNTINRIEQRLKDITKDAKTSQLDKTDLLAALEEALTRIAAEFGRLETDYQFLDRQAQAVRLSIDDVQRRITAFENFGTTNPGGRLVPDGRGGTRSNQRVQNAQAVLLQQELFKWQGEYWGIVDKANGVVTQANNLGAYRTRVIRDYERRSGEIVKKQNQMSEWSSRLKQRKGRVSKEKAIAKQKPSRAKKVTFKMLMPFDIKAERDQLLASFSSKSAPGDNL